MARRKDKDLLRNQDHPTVLGYELDRKTLTPLKTEFPKYAGKDTGAEPIGDGTFRMYPSGDIVNFDERCRRLTPIKK